MLSISEDAILKAERLSKYFIAMAKKIKANSMDMLEMRNAVKEGRNKSKKDLFFDMYRANPDLNRSESADLLSVSRQQIYNFIREFDQSVK